MRPTAVVSRAAALAVLLGLALAAPARASNGNQPVAKESWPIEIVKRPLSLAAGMWELSLPVGINFSDNAIGKPVDLAPSIYYGVNDGLTVGFRHLVGLCITGQDYGCPKVYDDLVFDTIWRLWDFAGADLAFGAALVAAPLTGPFVLSGEVRLVARWAGGPVGIVIAPMFDIGITQRGNATVAKGVTLAFPLATTAFGWSQHTIGQTEFVSVPATVQLQLLPPLLVALSTAISGPVNPPTGSFGDNFVVPLAAAVVYSPSNMIDVGASFTWGDLTGNQQASKGTDQRGMQIFGTLRL